MFALLALNSGRPMSHQAITEAMWGGAPPDRARAQVHSAMSAIRAQLAGAGVESALLSDRFGYRLALPADSVDAGRFDLLTAQAKHEADDGRAAQLWREALGLFQGEPLADATGAYVDVVRTGLDERRMAAVEDLADAELRLGKHAQVATELLAMVQAYPRRERLRGRLMLALHGSGRQAQALELYHSYRRELSEQDGLDPGREIADLAVEILRTRQAPVARKASRKAGVPAMLPAGGRVFCGRATFLSTLDEWAAAGGVVAIDGMAGVGKTELAVHWAHNTHVAFPDGQLYVNLRGHSPGPVVESVEALARLLFALGTPPAQIPLELDDAVGLYRTMVADRRLLVLLDNARDADQVRPLLPGRGESFVLVTSRSQLGGLAVSDGARSLTLGVLEAAESGELLNALLGADALAAELAQLCAHLPLALRIAAASLASRRHTTAAYVADLRAGEALSKLVISGEDSWAVRAAFDSSFSTLPPTTAGLFALLGLAPGHDVTVAAVAALAGAEIQTVTPMLAELTRTHMLDEHVGGRYTFHDLLRLYARERADATLTDNERQSAISRLFTWYQEKVTAAADVLYPEALRLPGPATEHRFEDAGAAMSWLRDEESNLLAAAGHAEAYGPPQWAWRLADGLRPYLSSRASTVAWLTIATQGLAAAQKENDLPGLIASHLSLAHLRINTGKYKQAIEQYQRALEQSREAGWREAEGAALGNLGTVHARLCQLPEAVQYHEHALAIAAEMGATARCATILGNLGGVNHRLGRLAEAAQAMTQGMTLHSDLGSVGGKALQLNNLGIVLRELGRLDEARQALQEAQSIFRALEDFPGVGMVLCSLADLHRDSGSLREALDHAEQALALPELAAHDEHLACALNSAGSIHLRMSNHDLAIDNHLRARTLALQVGNQELEAESLIALACAQAASGSPHEAATHARQALAICRQTGHALLEGLALTALAQAHLAAGDQADAASLAQQALAVHQRTGHHLGLATTRHILNS
ncbi:AfsR/SARP family transcriptional regulator [Rhizocola hellebori]|nr:tetratricopeptide repeat protein [Rhizocola hellebori]